GSVRLLCVLALASWAAREALAQQPPVQPPPAQPLPPQPPPAQPPAPPEQTCKCRPKLAGPCFTVHGSASRYHRAPIVRISVAGTKRVLGFEGGVPEFLEEDVEVPGY